MALYRLALTNTLYFEDKALAGTISHDPGGRTRFGISERSHPGVYPEMAQCSRERALEIAEKTLRQYWRFDGVDDQPTANKLFDMAVNMGFGKAVTIAQLCTGLPIAVDGLWGNETEAAVNACGAGILSCLRDKHHEHYKQLASSSPGKYARYWGTDDKPGGWRERAKA